MIDEEEIWDEYYDVYNRTCEEYDDDDAIDDQYDEPWWYDDF